MNEAFASSTQSGGISRPAPRLRRLLSATSACVAPLHCTYPGGGAGKELWPGLQREMGAEGGGSARESPGEEVIAMGRGGEPLSVCQTAKQMARR